MIKTDTQQNFHAQMLADCRDILENNGITAILTNSALLGAYRDGEMIAHCPGAVLTTFRDEIKPKEKQVIADLIRAGFTIEKHFVNKNFKIRVGKGGLNIEIVGYSLDGKYYYRTIKNKRKMIPAKLLRPPYSKINLYGHTFTAPKNIKKFLNFLYKNWKVKLTSGSSPDNYKTDKHMVMR